MADKVHPNGDPSSQADPNGDPSSQVDPNGDPSSQADPNKNNPPAPPPRSFIVQVPKDQIYRVPPPENQRKFDRYTRRARRRRCGCCCCLCCTLLLLLLSLAVATAALYLAFRPKLISYSVESLSIKGLDLNSTTLADRAFSPVFELAILARNPNKKIGLYYRDGSSIDMYYSGVRLCGGNWPVFYQGRRNETLVNVVLVGEGIRLSGAVQGAMREEERKGKVGMVVNVRVPVRVKFGAAKLWRMTAKASCDVVVDRLAPGSKVLSRSCAFKLKVF